METEKNKRILINKFDVLYREIENIDYEKLVNDQENETKKLIKLSSEKQLIKAILDIPKKIKNITKV